VTKDQEPEGILTSAARTVAHAAGEAVIAPGLEDAGAGRPVKAPKRFRLKSKPKSGKRVCALQPHRQSGRGEEGRPSIGEGVRLRRSALAAHRGQDSGGMATSRSRLRQAIHVRQKARGAGLVPAPLTRQPIRQLQNRYFNENCKLREPIDVFTTPVGMLAV
jgi:hypothetical protein